MTYKNKMIALLVLAPFLYGCANNKLDKDEGWHSNKPTLVMKEKIEEKYETKKDALSLLDNLLSPFEDMTEYALANNLDGMNKVLIEIKNNPNKYIKSDEDIQRLELSVKEHNYAVSALISTRLFKKTLEEFPYSKYVKEQIHIENLDYMGFGIIALINQKKIDFGEIENLIVLGKKHWMAIKDKVTNENKVDTIDLLFQGLESSVINKNIKMLKILASMDLSMVDIIEMDFK